MNYTLYRNYSCWNVDITYGRLSRVVETWSAALVRLLADKRLKQAELAKLADVRQGTISDIINEKRPPDLTTLRKLAAALGVPLWLFFVDERQAALLRNQAEQDAILMRRTAIDEQIKDIVQAALAPMADSLTAVVEAKLTGTDNAPVTDPANGRSNAAASSAIPRKPEIVTTTREHPRGTERIKRRTSS